VHETELLAACASSDGVELNTIHGAKGRQWGSVFEYGASEGKLPHQMSLAVEDAEKASVALEGERRLAYVALSRAKTALEVIYSGEPSRFLVEAALVAGPSPAVLLTKPETVRSASNGGSRMANSGRRPVATQGTTKLRNEHPDFKRRYPHAYDPWTSKEDEELRGMLARGIPRKQICGALGRHPTGVNERIVRLRLK
jgi:ATP-dependent exoDNAse (exonuclease V) beta subunit